VKKDLKYFRGQGTIDVDEVLDWYINDSPDSANFMQNCRDVYESEFKKKFPEDQVKVSMLEMVVSGDLKVCFDIAYGVSGLMLKLENGNWKEV